MFEVSSLQLTVQSMLETFLNQEVENNDVYYECVRLCVPDEYEKKENETKPRCICQSNNQHLWADSDQPFNLCIH